MTPSRVLAALRPADAGGVGARGHQAWRVAVLAWLAVLLLLQSVGQLHRIQHWNLLDDAVTASAHIRASHQASGTVSDLAAEPDSAALVPGGQPVHGHAHGHADPAPAAPHGATGWLAWLWGDHHQAACELLDALSGQAWLIDHLDWPEQAKQAADDFVRLPLWVAPFWSRHVPHAPRGPPSAAL